MTHGVASAMSETLHAARVGLGRGHGCFTMLCDAGCRIVTAAGWIKLSGDGRSRGNVTMAIGYERLRARACGRERPHLNEPNLYQHAQEAPLEGVGSVEMTSSASSSGTSPRTDPTERPQKSLSNRSQTKTSQGDG